MLVIRCHLRSIEEIEDSEVGKVALTCLDLNGKWRKSRVKASRLGCFDSPELLPAAEHI